MEKKFFADAMLGKLARWMRTLGYDVLYEPHIDDTALLLRAAVDGRVVLTRDTLLMKRRLSRGRALFIESESLSGQLRQVAALFPIEKEKLLTRCLRCNALLESIDRKTAEEKVPPYVFSTQADFSTCPACERVYWGATHRQRMIDDLKKLLE
jgi:uncharacterized protein with PIN domain